jgi:S1-C subfamily serine protease
MRHLFNVAIVFSCLLTTLSAHADSPYAAIGIISSMIQNSPSSSGGSGGTGFLVNAQKGLVLTNLHNLATCAQALGIGGELGAGVLVGKYCRPENFSIEFPLAKGKPKALGIEILDHGSIAFNDSDPYQDWALLRIQCLGDCREIQPLSLAANASRPGDAVKIVGFPSNLSVGNIVDKNSNVRLASGHIANERDVIKIWQEIYRELALPADQYQQLLDLAKKEFFSNSLMLYHDALVSSGYSGSPILNASGDVVGIVWGAIGIWNGPWEKYPDSIMMDARDPQKKANQLAAGNHIFRWLAAKLQQY